MGTAARKRKRVMVVDDNETLLHAWKRLLDDEPCEAIVIDNAEKALEVLETQGADILISDIVMPGMDGFELIERARKLHRHLKVVLTTAYVCDFNRLHLDRDSPDLHVLLKPYNDLEQVGQFVHRLIDEDDSLETEEGAGVDVVTNPDSLRIHMWSL